jgi:hypothetical protein
VIAPRPPKTGVRLVALVAVAHGFGNQLRMFSVYERVTEHDARDRARAAAAVDDDDCPWFWLYLLEGLPWQLVLAVAALALLCAALEAAR